jgi:hypothetical protein
MLPDVRHQLEHGQLEVLVLGQILVHGLGCAPRHRKDVDALCAPYIGLVSIRGEAEGLDCCNQLRGDMDVGLVGDQWKRLEPFRRILPNASDAPPSASIS